MKKTTKVTFWMVHDPCNNMSLRTYLSGLLTETNWRLPRGRLVSIGETIEIPCKLKFWFSRATEVTVSVK